MLLLNSLFRRCAVPSPPFVAAAVVVTDRVTVRLCVCECVMKPAQIVEKQSVRARDDRVACVRASIQACLRASELAYLTMVLLALICEQASERVLGV